MKKITALLTVLALVLGLCACSRSAAATWQEQYDLGVRYLSEGNYREAIIAFNAAIEIDPKRADAYIGLADAYEAQGDVEQARQVLEEALTVAAEADVIRSRLDVLETSAAPEPTLGTTVEPTQEPTSEISNITWSLVDGTLTISGTGPMEDYGNTDLVPWYEDRDSIKKAVIEDGITSIGEQAFQGCSSLTSVTIGSNVTSIGYGAFSYCVSLTSVTIPNSVTSIKRGAFSSCDRLLSINVASGNPTYSSVDGVLFNADQTFLYAYPAGRSDSSYVIPVSVISIETEAFSNCSSLTSVTIPNSVTSIGEYAFSFCGLTSIVIPNSVTNIGAGAFSCYSLTSIEVASGNPTYISIDGVLFSFDRTLLHTYPRGKSGSHYRIPDGVTSIGSYAFSACSLISVVIPDGVTSIGSRAFNSCSSLTSVTIPNSVTSIGEYAFEATWNLEDVYYGGNGAQWNQIAIGGDNAPLLNATIHYNS